MQRSLVLVTALCFTTWMSSAHATHGRAASCCIQWSNTRVPVNKIKSYTIQSEGVCPISAVQFQTVLGKTICSDPETDWAKRAILKVDKERSDQPERQHCREVTMTDATPTVSTLPKTTTGHSPTTTKKWHETTEQAKQETEERTAISPPNGCAE